LLDRRRHRPRAPAWPGLLPGTIAAGCQGLSAGGTGMNPITTVLQPDTDRKPAPLKTAEVLAALATVEQDHHLVAAKIRALKEAVCCLIDPDAVDCHYVLARLRDMHSYFHTHLEEHFAEEETTLLPLLEQMPAGGPELAERLRHEHAEIRRKFDEFGNCLTVACQVEDELPKMVLRDLLGYGWELWEILDDHAHIETRAVERCFAQAFPAED
jgi:hypothetical protein